MGSSTERTVGKMGLQVLCVQFQQAPTTLTISSLRIRLVATSTTRPQRCTVPLVDSGDYVSTAVSSSRSLTMFLKMITPSSSATGTLRVTPS
uniref:Uncharacterized protein n=1 Tax=Brassica campestris TaxID=3711 RepID=A0A3P6A012_BRACM|nr:unnamed protein product [Brassica rapa]